MINSESKDGFLVEFLQIIDEATSEPNFVNLTVETMPSDNIVSDFSFHDKVCKSTYLVDHWRNQHEHILPA